MENVSHDTSWSNQSKGRENELGTDFDPTYFQQQSSEDFKSSLDLLEFTHDREKVVREVNFKKREERMGTGVIQTENSRRATVEENDVISATSGMLSALGPRSQSR